MAQVIKVGGNEIDQPGFLAELAGIVAGLTEPTVIVHGGGKEITQLQEKFGIQARYVDGLRISDEASLELVKMVLCGAVNTRIVEILVRHKVEAQGLSGLDRGLARARKMQHPTEDMQRVGEVVSVRGDILTAMLDQGITPVIAPICSGDDGAFNVNADQVAGAVALAIRAERVVFLTNVPGVLNDGALIETLDTQRIQDWIAQGIISGGMIPKVRTALETVQNGVPQARITNLDGLRSGTGTTVIV